MVHATPRLVGCRRGCVDVAELARAGEAREWIGGVELGSAVDCAEQRGRGCRGCGAVAGVALTGRAGAPFIGGVRCERCTGGSMSGHDFAQGGTIVARGESGSASSGCVIVAEAGRGSGELRSGEEAAPLGARGDGLDGEVEAVVHEQGAEAVGDGGGVEKGADGVERALLVNHLDEAGGVEADPAALNDGIHEDAVEAEFVGVKTQTHKRRQGW